jgi:hypothetical protein
MSVNESMIFLADVQDFSPGVGEFIALEVARGAGLAELHELHPDRVPNPIVVNRWRKRYPAFDVLMGEAELAAAQKLAWEVVELADDEDRQAAQVRNAMDARKWLAGKLSESFGGGKAGPTVVINNNGARLSDEQLMQIAQGRSLIEGEATVVEGDEDGSEG